jgi:hypothetical protein
MFYLLLILGLACMAAGMFAIGFAVPSRDTPFGSALLVVGSVAFTGGLIAVGLAATVAELRRVIGALKARMPVVPRPLRPADRKDGGEKRPGPPPRIPMPARSGPDGQQAQPMASMHAMPPMAPPPTLPELPAAAMPDMDPAPLRKPGPEWLRRAIAEIETAPNPADAVPGGDYYRDDVRPMPEVRPPDMRPAPELRPRMNAPPLFTPPAPEPPLQPPPPRQAAPAPASQRNIFDMVWPSERHRASDGPERQPDLSSEPLRPPEPRAAPLPQPLPPIGASAPQQGEQRPPAILKSGVIDEMAYTLFADGSIEANMPDGTMRFASIEELREHLEKHES